MKRLKTLFTALAFAVFAAAPITVIATPASTYAAFTPAPDCESRALLGLPVWFRGLAIKDGAGNCAVVSPADVEGGLAAFIWKIALNVIEMGMIIAGYVALFFILYGGFLFLTNGSNPSVIEKARTTIINSTIGLAIALGSIGILNLIFRVLG
ncbi:MAG: hypothetical protein WAV04_00655 [Candidatus Microsaccharimonas sp.]